MIIQYLKQFSQLSFSQKRALFEALYRLSFVVIQIKFRSMSWFMENSIEGNSVDADKNVNDAVITAGTNAAESLHESIRLASRLLPFSCECIPRSIVLRDMLQKEGVAAKVRVGVKKENVSLQSHAWVEVYGEAICENNALNANFTPIDSGNETS